MRRVVDGIGEFLEADISEPFGKVIVIYGNRSPRSVWFFDGIGINQIGDRSLPSIVAEGHFLPQPEIERREMPQPAR